MVRCDEGTSRQLPDALVRSVTRQAERNAEAVSALLNNSGNLPVCPNGNRSALPRGFLLELAAVMQVGLWEQQGFHEHLEQGLPSYRDCVTDLVARSHQGSPQFTDVGADSLYRRVLKVHCECFSWEADEILGKPVAIRAGNDDQILDAMASFLWEHRGVLGTGMGEQLP
jgi:hypothetical protein